MSCASAEQLISSCCAEKHSFFTNLSMAKQGKISLFHRRRGLHTPSLTIEIEKDNESVQKKMSTKACVILVTNTYK